MTTMMQGYILVLRFLRSRVCAVVVFSVLLCASVHTITASINTIYIRDEALGQPILLQTAENDLEFLLEQQGITVGPADQVEYTGLDTDVVEVYIDRAFPVQISVDRWTETVWTTGGTVRELLAREAISMNDQDLISIPTGTFLSEGDHIEINRVKYREMQEEEEIPFEVEERYTPLLRKGRRETLQAGQPGTLVKTYSERTVDGVTEESKLVGEKITAKPVKQIQLVGADVPVSDMDFGYEIVEGEPVAYQQVIREARAAGYHAGNGAHGASGEDLYYGHVAVDPEEIPYGSQLYIVSSDGAFVYGYAVASDTGLAVVQDIIDVDLYYETDRESRLNGIRTVDIYVL